MNSFDPNAAAGTDSGIFGLESLQQDSALILIPVPWEATTSYGGGTAKGPNAILKASHQVDLFDLETGKPYEAGIFMLEEEPQVWSWNESAKAGGDINQLSGKLNTWVYTQAKALMGSGKLVGLVGGDHSSPYGFIKALAEKHGSFGVLHFDAHADLRKAYQGYEFSHASIMYNVLKNIPQVAKLVQVGIRDFCEQEMDVMKEQGRRVSVHFDQKLHQAKFQGETWKTICQKIVKDLPEQVYISFDIDGLDPALCPGTGTPVPGGLSFQEAAAVLSEVVGSGRKIIGFDLNEVAPQEEDGEWNANVGARLLYKLCGWTLISNKKTERPKI